MTTLPDDPAPDPQLATGGIVPHQSWTLLAESGTETVIPRGTGRGPEGGSI